MNFSKEFDKVAELAKETANRFTKLEINVDIFLITSFETDCLVKHMVKNIVDTGIVRDTLASRYKDEGKTISESAKLPFSEDFQKIIKMMANEVKFGKWKNVSELNTIHFLIMVLKDTDSIASKELSKFGITIEVIDKIMEENKNKKNKKEEKTKVDKKTVVLDSLCRNITQEAKDGKIEKVIGREHEIERIVEILCRKKKNNPILIGDAGVGKTSIVEGLGLRIVEGDVPVQLLDKKIYELILTDLIAGTRFRGQFEEKLKAIVDESVKNDQVILFIDEFHTIRGAGGNSEGLDVANIFKPYLAKGTLRCLGATTPREFRYIEKDQALARRVQKVEVVEPTEEETKTILTNIKDIYESFHGVSYTEEAIEACVNLSVRYITDRFLPDKAIDLMDESGSRTKIRNKPVIPDRVSEIDAQIKNNQDLIEVYKKDEDYNKCSEIKIINSKLEAEKDAIISAHNSEKEVPVVSEKTVQESVALITGIPSEDISISEKEKLIKMHETLNKKIIGQEEAITQLTKALKRNRLNLRDTKKPIGSFFFMGESGTGKTLAAEKLAEFMFNTEDALIRFNMSEYMERHEVAKLIGAPPGYVGYEEGGQLTERVRRKPYSVILFDEIEKAHPDVYNVFLQILDKGSLVDAYGRKIDFRNTIIIMTSNIGASFEKTTLGFTNSETSDENKEIRNAFEKNFSKEFINRLDGKIVFRNLSLTDISKILDINIEELNTRFEKIGISISIDEKAKEYILSSKYNPKSGARGIKSAVREYIEDMVADTILSDDIKDGKVLISTNDDDLVIVKG